MSIKDANEKAKEAIAQALAKSVVDSGAGKLPDAASVPVALTGGDPVVGEVMQRAEVENASLSNRNLALAENPTAKALGISTEAEMMARTLAQNPAPSQPSKVAFGKSMHTVPSSIRDVPYQLHSRRGNLAIELWNQFLGTRRKVVSQLAAKAGFPSMPFVYFAQASWQLFELEDFRLKEAASKFEQADAEGVFQKGLQTWAGRDLAKIITRACEHRNVSILEGVAQIADRLEQKRANLVQKTQVLGSQHQWAGDDGAEALEA